MLLVFFLLFLKVVLSDLQFSQGVVFFLLSCQHLTAVCMHIFSFTYTFSWHMHAHLHRHTCLSHARTHTRSNATVVIGFCSSFSLAEFPFPLFSVILLRLQQVIQLKKKKKKKKKKSKLDYFHAGITSTRLHRPPRDRGCEMTFETEGQDRRVT